MRLLSVLFLLFSLTAFAQDHYLFIGTYTHHSGKGLYVYSFNTNSGESRRISDVDTSNASNTAYFDISADGKYLYANFEETPGCVAAYSFDSASGVLSFINKVPSGGNLPSYVAVTREDSWVAAANYSTGSVVVYRVKSDGGLKGSPQIVQHQGHSILPRQAGPHAHSCVFSPDEAYLLVPDLGLDKIMIYPFNKNTGEHPLGKAGYAASIPGSGPRHIIFHPNGKWVYNIEEISGMVSAYEFKHGQLYAIQRISAHPEDYKGSIGSADIHLSPDGKFLYCSNRGDENTITIFSVDKATGRLSKKGYQPTLGKKPRNFTIDPTGSFLLVANQDSDNIVIFKRDAVTGLLTPTGKEILVPSPGCLKMR